jgi:hypothetical protein
MSWCRGQCLPLRVRRRYPVRSARIDSGDAVDAAMRTREQHLLRLNEQYVRASMGAMSNGYARTSPTISSA